MQGTYARFIFEFCAHDDTRFHGRLWYVSKHNRRTIHTYERIATYDLFWRTLEQSNAVIHGSSTLTFMLHSCRQFKPRNLNIAVPRGGSDAIVTVFRAAGYSVNKVECYPYNIGQVARCFHIINQVARGTILILESSTTSVLPVVLGAHHTASMNILTARNFYSFYPHFTTRHLSICGNSLPEYESLVGLARVGVRVVDNGRHTSYEGSCGLECPNIQRRVRGMHGVGVVCWNPRGRQNIDFAEETIKWGIGGYCYNPLCQFYPYSRYVVE